MSVDMTPKTGDTCIQLPVTFDYKGGRGQNSKWKLILGLASVGIPLIFSIGIFLNDQFILGQKVCFGLGVMYLGLFVLRFVVFRELYYSDIFEELKATDFDLDLNFLWQIFEIDVDYPYICYYKNGYKGIFVRMEKDAITGKPDTNVYEHYDAVGDAYNVCHSLSMNMVHIDYMDNVGNDSRMKKLYDDLVFVDNPDMQEMLIDIYGNLQEEMSRNYACFDIYLFLTRDNPRNFIYNVQSVCNVMLEGNFITYKVLDQYDIAKLCVSLFNLHDFSVLDACDYAMNGENSNGIIPISVTHGDGTVTKINNTKEEEKIMRETKERRKKEADAEALRKRHEARHKKQAEKAKKKGKKAGQVDNENESGFSDSDDLNLF